MVRPCAATLVWLAACGSSPLPDLPRIQTGAFVPAVRVEVLKAEEAARSNARAVGRLC